MEKTKDSKKVGHGSGLSRRDFVGGGAAALAAFTFVPSHVLADPPSEKLNVASIGAGGMGGWQHA